MEERVSVIKLWSESGKGEEEIFGTEQRLVKRRSSVWPSLWVGVVDHCLRPKEEVSESSLEAVGLLVSIGMLKSPMITVGMSEDRNWKSQAEKWSKKREVAPGGR